MQNNGTVLQNERYVSDCVELALLDSLFDGFGHDPFIPFKIKGMLIPHNRLEHQFQLILAGLAEVPVFNMEIIPILDWVLNSTFAYIAHKGLHGKLLSSILNLANK